MNVDEKFDKAIARLKLRDRDLDRRRRFARDAAGVFIVLVVTGLAFVLGYWGPT